MASTLVRKVMLKIAADDGDTEAKLDAISKKADKLAEKHPDLKVKIDTAAASAKLAALRMELKKTDDEAKKDGGEGGGLRLLGDALNTGLLGGISGNIGEMSMLQKVMMGLNVATGLGEPLVAGLIVSTMGLAGGLVSAGLGAGVFGLAAKSAFSQVTAANTAGTKLTGGLGQLQRQLATATGEWNQFGRAASPGVARVMAGALKLIPDALKLAQPFLAPTEAALTRITGMLGKAMSSSGAKSFFGTMAKDSGSDLEKLAVAAGHVATGVGGIVRAFMPVSGRMLTDVDKITGAFSKWGTTLTGHSGFQSLMTMFKQDTPTVIGLLKNLAGITKTVVGEMTGMDTASNSRTLIQVAEALSGLVDSLLKAHPGLVEFALYMKMATDTGGKLANTVKGVSGAVKGLSDTKKAVSDFSAGFTDSKKAADEATGAAGTYGGKLSTVAQKLGLMKAAQVEATGATEEETVAQGELDGAMDANPIGLIIVAIGLLVVAFVELWKHSAAFRDFWKAAWKDIRTAAVDAWHFIDNDMLKPLMSGIDKMVTFVKAHWKLLAVIIGTILLGPIAGLVIFIATHWKQITSLTSKLTGDVTGFFRRLPGEITGALARLPDMLFSLGRNAISGLLNGLKSMVGGAIGDAESWGHDIANAIGHPFGLHFSEPSEALQMIKAGRNVGLGVAKGMTSSVPAVSASAAHLARAAGIGVAGHPGYGAAGAGGAQKLQVELNITGGNAAFRTFLKKSIRTTGGNVSVVGA